MVLTVMIGMYHRGLVLLMMTLDGVSKMTYPTKKMDNARLY